MDNLNTAIEKGTGKLLIVADDFTGACDTGVQFSKNHLKTIVITGNGNFRQSLPLFDILAVNTDSRLDDREAAYAKAYSTGKIAASEGIRNVYKKLDSTMRGNIGAELAGLMDSLGMQLAFVVPALPKYGRTTLNGMVYINGVLLEETEFAMDPRNPVKESFVPKVIGRQTSKKTAVIIYEYIQAGRETIIEKLEHHLNSGIQVIIFDAKDESDLDIIASVIAEFKTKAIFAGCSGLAEYLAKYLEIRKVKKSSIVIAGSTSEVTRSQIDFAVHYLPVGLVNIDIERILSGDMDQEKNRVLELVEKSVSADEDIIIRSAPSREDVAKSFEAGERYGYDRKRVSESVAVFLGETAADIIRHFNIRGMLLTGGDTAIKTAGILGIQGLILKDEIIHGIPFGHFAGEEFKNVIIVTKAGGFGTDDAIFRVLNFLMNAW